MKKLTQCDRVLFELEQAGEHGVLSTVFYGLSMPRFAARILELKQRGHNITSEPENGFTRYSLAGGGAGPSSSGPASTSSGEMPTHSATPSVSNELSRCQAGGDPRSPEPLSLFGAETSAYDRLQDAA